MHTIGSKSGYTFHPGCPIVRLNAAKKFVEGGGCGSLIASLKNSNTKWISGEVYVNVLRVFTLQEVFSKFKLDRM